MGDTRRMDIVVSGGTDPEHPVPEPRQRDPIRLLLQVIAAGGHERVERALRRPRVEDMGPIQALRLLIQVSAHRYLSNESHGFGGEVRLQVRIPQRKAAAAHHFAGLYP